MARFFHARHGKTHCPGGSDPIPCLSPHFWRGRIEAGVTLPDGNEETFAWTEFETSSDVIFTTSGATPSAVFLETPGSYAVSAWWDPAPNFNDGDIYWIAINDLWDSADTLYQDRASWAQLGDTIGLSWIRSYPPIGETVAPGAHKGRIQVDAGQSSGGVVTAYPHLEITFLGPMPDIVSSSP